MGHNGRRNYGTGTISERSDGAFQLKWYVRQDGKYHYKTVRGSRPQAERELRGLLTSIDTDSYVKPNRITVKELTEKWLAAWDGKVADKTYERYADQCRSHIIPGLGYIEVSKLTPDKIQEFLDSLRPVAKGREKLSPRTINHVRTRLSQILDWGIKYELITRNPCKKTDPQRVPKEEMTILTDQQLRVLLSACVGTAWEVPIVIAVNTGMRQGEVLALTWDKIDFDRNEILVNRSLERTRKQFNSKETKTYSSPRTIEVSEAVIETLKRHRDHQDNNAYNPMNLVCCRDDGDYVYGTNLTRGFQGILDTAKIQKVRFHDLRHTHASHLIRAGVDIIEIARRLGHASAKMTLDIYGHLIPQSKGNAVRAWDSILAAVTPSHTKGS